MPLHRRAPELLAPAGGRDAFNAAIAAGADAVYLGLGDLNARRGAENFTVEDLRSACDAAHLRGRRVYLTANVLVLPEELVSALGLVASAWAAGVDAVIVQDLGLLRMLRHALPEVRVHISTQVNTHSVDTLRALAGLGVARVTLARETSLAEIGALTRAAHEIEVETESFVHGALCVCYSGQCLLSSLVGGRSANRGLCAQPCRLPYALVDDVGRQLADVGAHLLSPKDLAAITVLPAVVASGVDSLKIEGRMKSADYVALVTGVYRTALDRALAAPDGYEVRDGELSVLAEAFSRGFTEAYLTGERGNEMMSYRRPNNRGVGVGRVTVIEGDEATIALERAIDSGDTLEFWTSKGRFAQRVGPIRTEGADVPNAPAGARATVRVEQAVAAGDRVFRVRNAALVSAAERLYSSGSPQTIPLDFAVRVVAGEPLEVVVTDEQGRSGSATGASVEPARTRAVTADEVAEHVGRLGGTAYRPASWDLTLSPGVGVAFSALHATRRAALAEYEARVLEPWRDRTPERVRVPAVPAKRTSGTAVRIVAAVADEESARACLAAGAFEVHLPLWEFVEGDRIADGVVPLVPRVCHDSECGPLLEAARLARRGVAGTLGALERLGRAGCEVQAHWSLNALNAQAVAQLAELGARLVWLSPELTLDQVREISGASPVPVGVAVGGRQELMVTEHCVLMSEGPCSRECPRCDRRQSTRRLRDRKGYEFPVITDPHGRTHLYNAVRLDVAASIPDLIDAGVSALRLDLESETPGTAAEAVAGLAAALERGAAAPRQRGTARRTTTTGHFFRGVS